MLLGLLRFGMVWLTIFFLHQRIPLQLNTTLCQPSYNSLYLNDGGSIGGGSVEYKTIKT